MHVRNTVVSIKKKKSEKSFSADCYVFELSYLNNVKRQVEVMPRGRTEATNRKMLLEFNTTSKREHCIFSEMQIIWRSYKWWQKTEKVR